MTPTEYRDQVLPYAQSQGIISTLQPSGTVTLQTDAPLPQVTTVTNAALAQQTINTLDQTSTSG